MKHFKVTFEVPQELNRKRYWSVNAGYFRVWGVVFRAVYPPNTMGKRFWRQIELHTSKGGPTLWIVGEQNDLPWILKYFINSPKH